MPNMRVHTHFGCSAPWYCYHFRHVIQCAALLLVQLALDGRHPLQLLLSVTVAGDALLCFHSLLEKHKQRHTTMKLNGDTGSS